MTSEDRECLEILSSIEADLYKYKDMDRNALLEFCINKKLAATLLNYNEEIDANSSYLLRKSSIKVLKALTKIQKNDDKDIIKQHLKEETKK